MANAVVDRRGVLDPQVLEFAGGRLHALGADFDVAERTSWVAPGARGRQRQSAYLMVDDAAAVLIDCGPSVLEVVVLQQLGSLLASVERLTIVLTRSEFETTGNMAAIAEAFPVDAIYATGGTSNPFDGFELAADGAGGRGLKTTGLSRVRPGTSLAWSTDRALQALRAPLRMLACGWFFDDVTKTLFASDGFGYTIDRCDVGVEEAYRNLAARYWWLPGARTSGIVGALDAILAKYDVERIAPTHGCVIEGRDAVMQQAETFRGALRHAAQAEGERA